MQRREFIGLVAGAAGLPFAVRAQAAAALRKVGVLLSGVESDPDSQVRIAAFRRGFADLGWKEGENVHIEYRWSAGKSELIRQYAEELVALAPDVILANSTPVIAMLKSMTNSIPVVFALATDPVGLGHVDSLSRPGGNLTGFTFIDPALIGKWIGLMQEVVPGLARAALLFDPNTTPFYRRWIREIETAHQSGAMELVAMPVGSNVEMETAIAALAQKPGSSLMIGPDPFNVVRIKAIAQLAAQSRLPAISVYRPFAIEGGLMAYGPDTADIFRRSAGYVDRILKGASPAELPVQQPDKFEFVVNLKAARALGLTVPGTVTALADEVIE
ncbi:putative ABC transport system substrate-binding protein [Bradyrhizobium erythrophlei]|jgi:putative ABC transport system substrate-binding protein|nr:putative ABC transport system substrate-binding protein [Bradyrhizobium erythrophlei]